MKKLRLLISSIILGTSLMATNITASAKVTAIDVNGNDGKVYEYQYSGLKASAVAEILNDSDPASNLYKDFISRKVSIKSYYSDTTNAYVDFSTVSTAAINASTSNTTFDINTFVDDTSTPTVTITPSIITTDSSGNIFIDGQSTTVETVVDMTTIQCNNPIDNYSTAVVFGLNVTDPQDYTVTLKGEVASFNTTTKTFGVTISGKILASDLQASDFVVTKNSSAATTITGIDSISVDINQNASYSLPTTVKATMSDKSTKYVSVTWDKQVDTTQVGTFAFNGTVDGYSSKVILTLNIKTTQTTKEELSVKDIAKKSNSVVYVEVYDENGDATASGSGFIISSDGKIATNYHVIEDAYSAKITLNDGTKYEVQGVYGYNKAADIAILKVDATGLSSVTLGDSSSVELGESVVAIGSPEGLQNTVSTGIISSIRTSSERDGYKDLQISVPITSGSSGGALFNMYGEVIGITYAGYDTTGDLNFAIPINDLSKFIDISTLTTIAKLNGYDNSGDTQQTTTYFPLLSDVPQPSVKYAKYKTDSNGKVVYYLYDEDSIKETFVQDYIKLLKSNGWIYYKSVGGPGDEGIYYIKGKNLVLITMVGDYLGIGGNIH